MVKVNPSVGKAELDVNGHEVVCEVPVAPPVGFDSQPSMIEHIRNLVRVELSRQASAQGFETFEDADDFDVDEDQLDPRTLYEAHFDPVPVPIQPVVSSPPADGPAAPPTPPAGPPLDKA